MTRRRLTRVFWFGAAAILVAAALIALTAVLRGSFSETDGRILGSLAALLFSGGAALAGLALAERGPARPLGWLLAASAPVGLAFLLRAVWETGVDGEEGPWQLAWSAALALVAGIVASTGLLFATRPALARLAGAAGALSGIAAALSIVAIWDQNPSDALAKTIGATWILASLAYFLVPVLQRWSSVGAPDREERVLATLGDVELVATRSAGSGVIVHDRPARDELLVLRRHG